MQTGESRGGCVVCGSGEAHTSVSDPIDYEYAVVPENRFEYRRCESCDSEWLFPRPSDAEIAAFSPEGYHYPRHLQVFSRKGLASLLERTGFTNTKIQSYPHCQIAISVQNALLEWGWKPRMEFGRSPIYGVLLAASLPFEVLAAVCNRSGVINFSARKPAA